MFRNVWFPGKFVPAIPGNRISQQFFCLNSWVITLCVAEFNLFWMNLIFLSSFRPIFFMFHLFFARKIYSFSWCNFERTSSISNIDIHSFPLMEAHISKLMCKRERDRLHCEYRDSWGPTQLMMTKCSLKVVSFFCSWILSNQPGQNSHKDWQLYKLHEPMMSVFESGFVFHV